MTTIFPLTLSQWKLKFPVFVLNQEPPSAANPMMGIKTLSKIYYSTEGYWKGYTAITKLAEKANASKLSVSSRTLCINLEAIFGFLTERDWSWKSCFGNNTNGVILFLLWCTVVVPSFKNFASIFPEIFFVQYFTIFMTCTNIGNLEKQLSP